MEDTLAVFHMIMIIGQMPYRYPHIKSWSPNFGGADPMLLKRMDNQLAAVYNTLPEKPRTTAKRFWYDTVGHGSKEALRCACDAFNPDYLVTGSEYPVLLPYENYAKTFSYIRQAGLPVDVADQLLYRSGPALFGL